MIESGNLEDFKKYIEKNSNNINKTDQFGNTLLHIAAKYAKNDFLLYLLDFPIDLEKRNKKGWTAMHFAAMGTNLSTLALLIDAGANVEPYGKDSPLHLAVYYDRYDLSLIHI